jgi:hypothetical protein
MSPQTWVIAEHIKVHILPSKDNKKTGFLSWNILTPRVFRPLIIGPSPWLETVMKQSDLDSMSIDELCVLHEQVTATLAARISVERDALLDQLKHADMSVH